MSRRRRRPGTAVAKRAIAGDVLRYDPTFDAWASAYQQVMGFGGLNYPLTGFTQTGTRVEPVAENYLGFAQAFYRANGIVFAVSMARARLFTEARPCFRNLRTRERFTTEALAPLENPWPGGTIRDLLMRMEQDVTCGGNAFVVRDGERLRRYRPDWVELILSAPPDQAVSSDVVGIKYTAGGPLSQGESQLHLIEDVCFWSPIPDPLAAYRGMSWLTPIIREVQADTAATQHKQAFFENAATPNLAVSLKETVTIEQFKAFKAAMDASHAGARNAYKTLYLGGGADVKVVGADLRQLEFKQTQGAGETRIAAAGGVPPIVAGLSEGLQNATYSNYGQARRAFGDHWARPQWGSAFAALAPLIDVPAGAELWYDDREVAFLREDLKDMAEIQATEAATIGGLIQAGYEPDSIIMAVVAKDWSLLSHTGLFSVQLQPPGAIEAAAGAPALESTPATDEEVPA